jgi:hypothetical protein
MKDHRTMRWYVGYLNRRRVELTSENMLFLFNIIEMKISFPDSGH